MLQNLYHPFGVVPLSIADATFSATLTQKGAKKQIKARDVIVNSGLVFDYLLIDGGFAMDTEAKSSALNLGYTLCGATSTLLVNSSTPDQVPGQIADSLLTIAKSIATCVDTATCPAGYTKAGLQCDATCPPGATSSPGVCDVSTKCAGYRGSLSAARPSCVNPDNALVFPQ